MVIGDGATIVSGMDRSSPGGITMLPQANVDIQDSVGTWSGGAFSFSTLASKTTANVTTAIEIGNNVTLSTRGDMNLGTATKLTAKNKVVGTSAGALANVNFNATTTANVDQRISFGTNARVAADGAMQITAGVDPSTYAPTGIDVRSVVDGETGGAITTISVVAKPTLTNSSVVTFGSYANVGSGGDMRMAAETGNPSVTSDGKVTYYDIEALWNWITGDENIKRATDVPQQTNTSQVNLAGSFTSGYQADVSLTIPANFSGGTLAGTPATVGGMPVTATFDTTFDPQKFITANFGDSANLLASSVPAAGKAVRISPIAVRGGNISVVADSLTGTAMLDANQPHITITNDSPNHLVLDTLAISSAHAGKITLEKTGRGGGGTAATPGTWAVAGDTSEPTMEVRQNYNQALDSSGYGPAIFMTSAASNPKGDITISNDRGSLGVIGTINAKSFTVEVPNGTSIFYVKGAVHSGQPPVLSQPIAAMKDLDAQLFKSDAVDLLKTFGNGTLSYSSNTVPSSQDNTAISAQQIAIFADTINVNGDLLIGQIATTNKSVTVPKSLEAELQAYLDDYLAGRQTNPLYRIPADKLSVNSGGDEKLGLTFNAQTSQLILDGADMAGGTRLTLAGKIINTSPGAGAIKVNTAGGGVTVANNTKFPLVTQAISTPGTGGSTTVRIVDMLKPEATRQTLYRSTADGIAYYVGRATDDLLSSEPTSILTDATSTTYLTAANSRWKWVRERLIGLGFGSPVSDSGWVYAIDNDPTTGQVEIRSGASAFERSIEKIAESTLVTFRVTDSVRADYPIGLSFTGLASSGVNITSQGSVLLRDSIDSKSVCILSSGSIDAVAGTEGIKADNVTLTASSGIGRTDAPLPVSTSTLSAQTGSGDVSLLVNQNEPSQAVTLISVGTYSGGSVLVTAGGDIRASALNAADPLDANIIGGKALIRSEYGSVGTAVTPIRSHVSPIDKPAALPLRLDVTAAKDVFVNQLEGDLLVGTVTAQAGDVGISAAGNLLDAHTWTVNPNRQAEIDKALDDLGVLNPDKAIATATANFQAVVKTHYLRYWSILADGVVFDGRFQLKENAYDNWAALASASLGLSWPRQPSEQQVLDYAAKAHATETDYFSRTIGQNWASLAAFRNYDGTWTYVPTQAQIDQLKSDLGLNSVALIRRVGVDMGTATRPWDPAVRVGGTVNVSGRNVTLLSTGGTIGRIAEPVTILQNDILQNRLTDAQNLELELAGQRGDAVKVDGGYQFRTLRPLVVMVSGGKLIADGDQGVAVAQPTGSLVIGDIKAEHGKVDVAADGDITNAQVGAGITTKTASPQAVSATLFTRSGSIGTTESPIAVAGGVVTAGALAGTVNIDSPYPVVPENPPQPQPDAPLEPWQPRILEVDSIAYKPTDTPTFTLAATGSDQIACAGMAVLDGTISVALADGYTPKAGDEITLMTWGSVRGHFAAGRGLYGQVGDLWFQLVQTGDETTAGSLKLVVSKFIPGLNQGISLADSLGVDTSGTRDHIGELLNYQYFKLDLQITFPASFSYGSVAAGGTITLRYASRYDRYEMAIDGTATVGTAIDLSGKFIASLGMKEGGEITSLAMVADDVMLDTNIGGAKLQATHGRIGLLVSDAGVAFEGSAGISASLSSDLSLTADEIRVQYNPTSTDYSGVMFALGSISYSFGSLAPETFRVGVSQGELIAGGFVRASGSFAVEGRSQDVTLADGSTITADVLTIGGRNLGGFAGTGAGTHTAAGIEVAGVNLAAAIVTERVTSNTTARRWLTVEGSGDSASLRGVSGVTGSLTNTAISLNLPATDGSVVDYRPGKTELTVSTAAASSVGMTLSADGSKGRILRASGSAALAVEGALSLGGQVGISLDDTGVVVVGTGISAQFGTADAATHFIVSGASFGLFANAGETAFELGQGSLDVSIAGFASVKAAGVVAQYTSFTTTVAAGLTLDTGTASYTFQKAIGPDTVLFSVKGFEATVANFVTLTGDVGFKSDPTGITAVGANLSARLVGTDVASLSVTNGAFGLNVAGGETAFELSARNFQFQLADLPAAKAETVFLRYTSSGREVAKGEKLVVGGVVYTFAEPIARDTAAFAFGGFSVGLSSSLSVTGSLGFARQGSDLIGVGSDISVTLAAGGLASVTASNGSFGLVENSSGFAFEIDAGFTASIAGLGQVSASRAKVHYASSGLSVAGGRRVAIGGVSHTFKNPILAGSFAFSVEGFTATASGFTPISGDLGFEVSDGELVAVGTDISAGVIDPTYGGIANEHARFGLVANSEGTAFELSAGSLRVQVADLAHVRSGSTYVQYSTPGISLSPWKKISAGGLDYHFVWGVSPGAARFAVTDFQATVKDFVSIAGDVGFSLVEGEIIAVGDHVTATLAAGDLVSLSVGGRLGLLAKDDQLAFELTGTDLSANVANLAHTQADHVFVQYTTPATSIARNQTLQVGEAAYTFTRAITPGTIAFDVKGFSADLFGVVSVSGDIGFAYRPSEFLITAYTTDFSAAFKLGDQIEASVSHATFDLRLGTQMLFALQGEARLKLFGLIDKTTFVRIQPDYARLTLDDGSQVDAAVMSFAAALPDLFFGKQNSDTDRVGLALDQASFGFAVATDLESNRFWVAAKAHAALGGFVGMNDFSATVADANVVINTKSISGIDGRSVDWSQRPVSLQPILLGGASPAEPVTLDMKGATLAASGTVHAKIQDQLAIDGSFSFETSRRDVSLVGGGKVDVDLLSIGIHDASAFIGTTKDGTREGLVATDVNLGFGLFRERTSTPGSPARAWSLLDASVGQFSLTGIDGVQLSATGVSMDYIHLPADGSAIDTSTPITYDDQLAFKLGADRMRPGASSLFAFAGMFDVNLKGLVQFQRAIDIQVELDTLQIYDPVAKTHTAEDVVTMSFATLGQDLFAGDDSSDKRVGLELTDVNLAAVVAFGPQTGSVWVAVDASATGVQAVGLGNVDFQTNRVELQINTPDYRGTVIDFKAQPLEVPVGIAVKAGNQEAGIWGNGQSATLALDGKVGGENGVVQVADGVLDIAGFLYAEGDFAFRIGQYTAGLVVNGLTTGGGSTRLDGRFAVVSLVATDVNIFAGYRGPDSGISSGPFTATGVRDGAVGLYARGIDFGYAFFTNGLNVFDSLKLNLQSAGFVGLGDAVTATLEDVEISRNGGLRLLDARLASIDFQQSFPATAGQPAGYPLSTPGGTVKLDAAQAVQWVSASVGKATLKVDGFLELTGSLAIKAGGQIFGAKANPGVLGLVPGVAVTGLTHDLFTIEIGGSHLSGFAGVTVPAIPGVPGFTEPRRMGTELTDVDFGLAIMSATSVAGITVPGMAAVMPTYIAAKATVGSAKPVGMDSYISRLAMAGPGSLIPTMQDVTIDINTSYLPFAVAYPAIQALAQVALPMPALDLAGTAFSAGGTGLEVATGDPANPVLLDYRNEIIAVDVGYFDASLFNFFDFTAGSDNAIPKYDAMGVDLVKMGVIAANAVVPASLPSLQVAGKLSLAKRGGERVTLADGRQIDVQSLGFSMTDVRGFTGAGSYWGRNPVTGQLDGTVTDPSAIGFAIDNLNLGAVFMLRMPGGLNPIPAVYIAANATLDSARIVGAGPLAQAELKNFEFHVNLAASTDFNVVDLSKSKHVARDAFGNAILDADGNPVMADGYLVAGSQGGAGFVLDYKKALLETQGIIDVNLLGVAELQGDFFFTGSGSNILLYVSGASRLGTADGFHIESHVDAFLRADSRGVVSKVKLATDPIQIGTAVEIIPAGLSLVVNTTGNDVVFTIPDQFQRPGGPTTINVSATPPGGSAPASYIAASGTGSIRLGDVLQSVGSFDLLMKTDISTLVFNASLQVPVLAPLVVKGALTYLPGTQGGLFGSVLVGAEAGTNIIDTPAFSLAGAMLLEVNTSTIPRQVSSFRRPGEEDTDGDGYVLRSVAPSTLRLAGNGQLTVAGVRFDGWQSLIFDPGRVRMSMASHASVGFGSLDVAGDATILYGENRATALILDARAYGTVEALSRVEGTLRINTDDVDFNLDDGTIIKAHTDFDAAFNARLGLGNGLFTADVAARMFRTNGQFEVWVDGGSLDFFGIRFDVSGFYRSNGEYLFSSSGKVGFTVAGVTASGSITMSLARNASRATTFKGTLVGTTKYNFGDSDWLKGNGPSLRGDVTFGPSSVSFSASVSIAGITIPLGYTWKRQTNNDDGPPVPVIARLAGNVLTLSAGDSPDRYGVTAANWYGGLLSESFQVNAVIDSSGKPVPDAVIVRSLGVEQKFTGVKTIVADGGLGNDVFEFGPGVDAVLRISGGPGSDTIIAASPAAGSVLDGGVGTGYDSIGLAGKVGDYLVDSKSTGVTIAQATTPAATWQILNMESVRFADKTIAYTNLPSETRAFSGPIVNGSIFFDIRTYADDGSLLLNCDLTPGTGEPTTGTDSRGAYDFGDLLNQDDRNGDGIVDYRDGMVVVGSYSNNGIGTSTSAVDSITGSDLGFPLVGLPGHSANLMTTLKYATLLRWQPDQLVAGRPVTPELIQSVLNNILADVPTTFTQDDFDPYSAISSSNPAEVQLGVDTIRFTYTHLINVLTVAAMLREFGLDYTNEAAWTYHPDPEQADQLEIVAFSSYLKAIAARFGEHPLDTYGRTPVAAKFDPLNPAHVRAVFAEILWDFPTRRVMELDPEIISQNLVANATESQAALVQASIETHLGTFLDNVAEGLVLTQKAMTRRVTESAALSELLPEVGTQLLVPSVAGLKRLTVDKLATALVVEGQKSPDEFRATYNPLFYQPKPVESATQPTVGLIGLSAPGGSLAVLSPTADNTISLTLDYADKLGPLAAPDYGLGVRYRLGGTAREGVDYTIDGNTGLPIATISPGQSSGTLTLRIAPGALAAGDRYLQIELLSADSGMKVDGSRSVVTIAFGPHATPQVFTATGDRTSFVPHQLVTETGSLPAVLRAPSGGENVVLRGVNGRADTFVIGHTQSVGIPFIENFNPADGDQIWIASGGLLTQRREMQLSSAANRSAALDAIRQQYGSAAIDALSPETLDSLLTAEIDSIAPLDPFVITQLNTYGGFIFDVTGQCPIAMVSNYSTTGGDSAWASLSMNPAGGTAIATEVRLSTNTVAENAPAGSFVGTLTTIGGRGSGPYEYSIIQDSAEILPFTIIGDQLVATEPLNFEFRASYLLQVRSIGTDGIPFDAPLLVKVLNLNESPTGATISATSVLENAPPHTIVGQLSANDPDLGGNLVWTLVDGPGSTGNASFEISGNELVTSRVLDAEWKQERSVRVRATDSSGAWTESVLTIHVQNIADTPLAVNISSSRIAENSKVGTLIGSLRVPGATSRIRFSLVEGEGDTGNHLVKLSGQHLVSAMVYDQEQTPYFQVRVRATDVKTGVFTDRIITIKVRDIQERPTVSVPASFSVVQNTPGKLVFAPNFIKVDDVRPVHRLTVILKVRQGEILAASGFGVTVGGTKQFRTFTGDVNDLNAYFSSQSGQIIYRPKAGELGNQVLKIIVREPFQRQFRITMLKSNITIS